MKERRAILRCPACVTMMVWVEGFLFSKKFSLSKKHLNVVFWEVKVPTIGAGGSKTSERDHAKVFIRE